MFVIFTYNDKKFSLRESKQNINFMFTFFNSAKHAENETVFFPRPLPMLSVYNRTECREQQDCVYMLCVCVCVCVCVRRAKRSALACSTARRLGCSLFADAIFE